MKYVIITVFFVATSLMLLVCVTSVQAQSPLDISILKSLGAKSSGEEVRFADEWAASNINAKGREQSASDLVGITADGGLLSDHARLIRLLGKRIDPEFTNVVLKTISSTNDPLARGGLLQLLREADPNTAASLEKWLSDERPGEDLVEQSKRAPKLREAIANGAVAFRVCDIVFNVMQELRGPNDPSALRLTRSQSIEARDEIIRQVRGTTPDATPDATPDEVRPQPLPTIVPQPTRSARQPSETKSTSSTQGAEPTSSTPWSIIVVLIVAACGLLWLLLKRRL
jgi:hypothetical protein